MASNMKNANQPYQTYPIDSESRVRGVQQSRHRGSSKPHLTFDGDIPLLPVMPADNTSSSAFHGGIVQGILANSKSKVNTIVSSGAIPLLDLSEEQQMGHGAKTKKSKKSKR
jgi:hypothetical protein